MSTDHPFKKFRKAHGLGQSALAVLLGLDSEKAQSRISQYETGDRSIPLELAYKFIDAAEAKGEQYTLEDIYPRKAA